MCGTGSKEERSHVFEHIHAFQHYRTFARGSWVNGWVSGSKSYVQVLEHSLTWWINSLVFQNLSLLSVKSGWESWLPRCQSMPVIPFNPCLPDNNHLTILPIILPNSKMSTAFIGIGRRSYSPRSPQFSSKWMRYTNTTTLIAILQWFACSPHRVTWHLISMVSVPCLLSSPSRHWFLPAYCYYFPQKGNPT